jgi:hypothetical protein
LQVGSAATNQAATFKGVSCRTDADLIRIPTQLRLGEDSPNRKNALFYKTMNGAQVGDLFMSLIHTCELNKVNPFGYLTELLRHWAELTVHPTEWMPWNYRSAANAVAT